MSRPEISCPKTEKSGRVSFITQVSDRSRAIRLSMARARPMTRALGLSALRQTRGQDGYEDDVIDAQDDLEGGQRRQRDQGLGAPQ